MNKKGFTLTEILGVVVILGLLMLLVTPAVLNSISSNEQSVTNSQKQMLKEAVSLYRENHKRESLPQCVSIQTLKNEGYLNTDFEGVTSDTKNITGVNDSGEACTP